MKHRIFMALMLLSGCVYSETPQGRYTRIELPAYSRTTINKTTTFHAPAGTTIVYGDDTPAYRQDYDCDYDRRNRRRCYPRAPRHPREVYRIEGGNGSITQTYEESGFRF